MLSDQKLASLPDSSQRAHYEDQMREMIPRNGLNRVSNENSKEKDRVDKSLCF